jgi:hypothetical protein
MATFRTRFIPHGSDETDSDRTTSQALSMRPRTAQPGVSSGSWRVSDGTRTRDRLDHNPMDGGAVGSERDLVMRFPLL